MFGIWVLTTSLSESHKEAWPPRTRSLQLGPGVAVDVAQLQKKELWCVQATISPSTCSHARLSHIKFLIQMITRPTHNRPFSLRAKPYP